VVIVGSAVPEITGRYFHLLNVGGRIFVMISPYSIFEVNKLLHDEIF
jgi:hypothetical protein